MMEAKDKSRYEREQVEFTKKGYFTLSDGTRSSELDEAMNHKRKSRVLDPTKEKR